ncbi:MAG: cobalamin-dependent protein, partial [Limisphaerales bacterium]
MAHPKGNRSILLLGINAKFIHASFGLRYLQANLGALKSECVLLECDINQRAIDIVEKALETKPCLIGIGVYIWNAPLVRSVVHLLKKVSPQTIVVLGGPEVSFEIEKQDWLKKADHIITGEGDLAFRKLCETRLGLVASDSNPPWLIHGGLPELSQVA